MFQIWLEETEDPAGLLGELKKEGLQVIGTAAGASLVYWQADYRQPTAVVIGNEAGGINPELLAAVDCSVAIPLS
ncbi:TrmH family RNA methyltransferase, partial [Klebsiella pneumoniae]|uniref:TrmH family RNA methyltransferase n=1 Tax=Klebsiella pneumoniae TaxID=573 RepID=UPI00273085F4